VTTPKKILYSSIIAMQISVMRLIISWS